MFKKKEEELKNIEKEIENKKEELKSMEEIPKPKEEQKEEPKEETIFKVGQIPTEHQQIIFSSKTDEQFSVLSALAKMMNDIENLKEYMGK